jgi:peroxiredoxin
MSSNNLSPAQNKPARNAPVTGNAAAANSRGTRRNSRHDVERTAATRVFIWLLGSVSFFYAVILIYHASVPQNMGDEQAFLEKCRRICLRYGLVSAVHVRQNATELLKTARIRPLSASLTDLISDQTFVPEDSQPHVLVGKAAPDFSLRDNHSSTVRLADLTASGPVVAVFYSGCHCNHCVTQLYSIQQDLNYFTELGVSVVALSGQSFEQTEAACAEHGRLDFPLLSDPGNLISGQYGCSSGDGVEGNGPHEHGTFLIDQHGQVAWASTGAAAFVDNRSLLVHLARLQNVTPVPASIASTTDLSQ